MKEENFSFEVKSILTRFYHKNYSGMMPSLWWLWIIRAMQICDY